MKKLLCSLLTSPPTADLYEILWSGLTKQKTPFWNSVALYYGVITCIENDKDGKGRFLV